MRGPSSLGALSMLAGCVLQPVDLDGKACPCASGWICDESTQTCRAAAATSTTSTTSTDTTDTTGRPEATSSGGSDSGGTPQGRFEVLAFAADWSTPESIHWTWEVDGDEADFHAWILWLATDEAALESGEGVLVFDGDTNPELDRFVLKNTQGVDPVVAALTRGLEPGTDYFAKLFVLDTSGGQSESPNVAVRATTAAPTEAVLVFGDDALVEGAYPLPACYTWTDASPYEGTHHFQLDVRCDAQGDPTCGDPDPEGVECWENLRLQSMSIPLTGLDGGDLSDAFLEFHLAIDPGDRVEGHGWWSAAGIHPADQSFSFSPLTLPATASYERFQVPLSVLGVTLDALGSPLSRVFVGSQWQSGSVLRFDEARVRW